MAFHHRAPTTPTVLPRRHKSLRIVNLEAFQRTYRQIQAISRHWKDLESKPFKVFHDPLVTVYTSHQKSWLDLESSSGGTTSSDQTVCWWLSLTSCARIDTGCGRYSSWHPSSLYPAVTVEESHTTHWVHRVHTVRLTVVHRDTHSETQSSTQGHTQWNSEQYTETHMVRLTAVHRDTQWELRAIHRDTHSETQSSTISVVIEKLVPIEWQTPFWGHVHVDKLRQVIWDGVFLGCPMVFYVHEMWVPSQGSTAIFLDHGYVSGLFRDNNYRVLHTAGKHLYVTLGRVWCYGWLHNVLFLQDNFQTCPVEQNINWKPALLCYQHNE